MLLGNTSPLRRSSAAFAAHRALLVLAMRPRQYPAPWARNETVSVALRVARAPMAMRLFNTSRLLLLPLCVTRGHNALPRRVQLQRRREYSTGVRSRDLQRGGATVLHTVSRGDV